MIIKGIITHSEPTAKRITTEITKVGGQTRTNKIVTLQNIRARVEDENSDYVQLTIDRRAERLAKRLK